MALGKSIYDCSVASLESLRSLTAIREIALVDDSFGLQGIHPI